MRGPLVALSLHPAPVTIFTGRGPTLARMLGPGMDPGVSTEGAVGDRGTGAHGSGERLERSAWTTRQATMLGLRPFNHVLKAGFVPFRPTVTIRPWRRGSL